MILDMIQGCRYLWRLTDRWLLSKNSTTRLKDSKVGTGSVCCEIVRSLLQSRSKSTKCFEENFLPNGVSLPNSAHKAVSFLYQLLVLTVGGAPYYLCTGKGHAGTLSRWIGTRMGETHPYCVQVSFP
jgi:hypothetical protein